MFKKFKIILKIVEWIVFAFLLCFLFILFSAKLPFKNVPKSFVVISGSMEPAIKTGSVAFVKNIDSKNIKTGDIIAFTSPSDQNDTILHRVASISSIIPLTFKTKGDHNNDIDAWDVADVGVKGVYITAIPYLGYIATFIKKPLGFGLIIGIPALIFIIFQLFNIKKGITEEIDRKVSQKLNETKKADSTKTILKSLIFFIIFVSTLFSLSSINIIKAVFFDTVTISNISISVADFTKPTIPTLISPTNNTITSSQDLVMDWSDVINHQNPNNVFYIYQSSLSSDFSSLTSQVNSLSVSKISVSNNLDGIYYWRVKACFAADNCSDWSESWKLTIDSTIPTSTITQPIFNLDDNNQAITTKALIKLWDKEIKGTALDNLSGIKKVELSIAHYEIDWLGRKINETYWNGSDWTNGTESSVRINTIGTTGWSYKINGNIPSGFYKIVSHAIDNANNMENSAVILFEYIPESTSVSSPSLDFSLSSNHSADKINLEITNISTEYDYEILYIGNGIEKGIFGHINSDEIINSKYSKYFYLGTCSTGGTCTPENIEIGSTVTVNLTGSQNITKTFTY